MMLKESNNWTSWNSGLEETIFKILKSSLLNKSTSDELKKIFSIEVFEKLEWSRDKSKFVLKEDKSKGCKNIRLFFIKKLK